GPCTLKCKRSGDLRYDSYDKELRDEAVNALRCVDVLVFNALFRTQHPTHLIVSEAVTAAQKVGARQTWLTHLTHRTGHAELEAELPRGIAPAFDGLTIEIA